ncbi:outer envelope protein 80, chloroplastic [Tanacetum coccineum]
MVLSRASMLAKVLLNSATGSPLSLIVGSLCIKHPNLFGKSEKLDVLWDKGLSDSNILIAYRKPRPEWLAQHSLVIQHSVSPEVGIHGVPVDNFSRTGSGGVNLCRFSAGVELDEPGSSNWNSKTSVKFEAKQINGVFDVRLETGYLNVRPVNDDGRSICRDLHGFPVTCRNPDLRSLTGGSIVGDIAPYQAFAIGGLGSVRGYGEGAVGCGRSCLVANTELTFPVTQMLDGALFCDCGTDLGSGRYVPGNPGLRHGKPVAGVGVGMDPYQFPQWVTCKSIYALNKAFTTKDHLFRNQPMFLLYIVTLGSSLWLIGL